MTVIAVGAGATDRDYYLEYNITYTDTNNPANATGTLTSAEFWFYTTATGVKVGTFYGSSTSYTYRAGATIGSVTKGSKQTFTGLSFAVTIGDFIGFFSEAGALDGSLSGGGTAYYLSNDHCVAEGAQTYAIYSGIHGISIYATGATVAAVIRNKVLSYRREHIKRMEFHKRLLLK